MNVFEQHALAQQRLMPPAPAARLTTSDSPLMFAMRFIEGANLDQCGKVALHLSARLFSLEKQHSGMKAANLNEAAHFVADAALDIDGALKASDEVACSCGRCDDCVAARSDEHHDRKRDGLAR